MTWITITTFIIGLVLGIIILIILFVKAFERKGDLVDLPINTNVIINFMGHSKGSAVGRLHSTRDGKKERKIKNYVQWAIDELSNDERITLPIPVETYQVETIPKGVLDDAVSIDFLYPKSVTEFPKELKRLKIGKALMMVLTDEYAEKTENDYLNSLNTTISKYLQERPPDVAVRDMLLSIMDANKKFVELRNSEKSFIDEKK